MILQIYSVMVRPHLSTFLLRTWWTGACPEGMDYMVKKTNYAKWDTWEYWSSYFKGSPLNVGYNFKNIKIYYGLQSPTWYDSYLSRPNLEMHPWNNSTSEGPFKIIFHRHITKDRNFETDSNHAQKREVMCILNCPAWCMLLCSIILIGSTSNSLNFSHMASSP